jgi:hypothetical protein
MARWRVEMFRKRLQRLGTIDAGIAQAGLGNDGRLRTRRLRRAIAA